MGLMDKVKEQAEKAKGQATNIKAKVEERVEDVQGKRKSEDLLVDLGRLVYGQRTERPPAGADAEAERLVVELKKLEDEGVKILSGS